MSTSSLMRIDVGDACNDVARIGNRWQ